MSFRALPAIAALVFLGAAHAGYAQAPVLPDEERFGRPVDEFALPFCVDSRDPGWQVDRAIGEAIAQALLLEPRVHVVEASAEREDIDNLYRHLREDCRLYFGFKLVPQIYPDWLTTTRPYLELSYQLVVADPAFGALADIPPDLAIAPTLGTTADFALVQYLGTLPADQRWRRFPMSTDALALEAVLAGDAAAALVWGPSFGALAAERADFAPLRAIPAAPLPLVVSVGAVLLDNENFLRSTVDSAIAALIADGTIAAIAAEAGYGTAPGS